MTSKTPSLAPREHGAYAQLGVALACALALAPSWRSLSLALLTGTLFFASEPVLILLGRRGPATLHACRDAALQRLATLGCVASLTMTWALTGTLLGGWVGLPPAFGLSLLPPALLGLALFGLFLAGRERTGAGEVLAAWAFAATTPACALLGGRSLRSGALLALLLAAMFTLGTAVVHGHLKALRKGGTGAPRLMAFLLGVALTEGLWVLGARGLLPRSAFAALLPMTLAAFGIWRLPPAPHRLKAVGWAAAFCALAGGALAVASLR